jgi:hypothetical protein
VRRIVANIKFYIEQAVMMILVDAGRIQGWIRVGHSTQAQEIFRRPGLTTFSSAI